MEGSYHAQVEQERHLTLSHSTLTPTSSFPTSDGEISGLLPKGSAEEYVSFSSVTSGVVQSKYLENVVDVSD